MYKEFFNFSAEPFRITPDPGFLFLTDQHKEALAAIITGISRRKGFVCITGEVGVGKTTILRSYLESADEPSLRFVYVYNPNVSFQTLLRHICKELGVPTPGDDIATMVDGLRASLLEHHNRHETLVLLIDEAQNMPMGTLENLRMLSNLETATEKLVQIVLVGQPELEALLAERQLRQLESRIAVRTRLGPLSRQDSAAYIHHRLRCVALDNQTVFTEAAIRQIVSNAQGIPRRINVLCDTALMTAFGRRIKPVSAAIVRDVLRDTGVKKDRNAKWTWRVMIWAGGAIAVAAMTAGFALYAPGLPHIPPELPHRQAASQAEPAVISKAEPAPPIQSPPQAKGEQPPEQASITLSLPAAIPPAEQMKTALSMTSPAAITEPAPQDHTSDLVRIVAPGDTLAGLASQVYGKVDRPMLEGVKARNPEIVNVDRIHVGQIIVFPNLGENRGSKE